MKRSLLLLFLLSLLTGVVFAQEEIGLNPPSIKWRKINSPAGRIIFPEGLDSVAFRAAGIMAWQLAHDTTLIGSGMKAIPTIIQNQSVLPAGFSTPAPWRNEFYITPPQNLFTGPTHWIPYLTTHEYRHAQQFAKARRGWTIPFRVLMGQTGWLLNTLITQPLWFREGDAVVTETALTNAGRGEVPRFHMETRALRLSGYKYGYEKSYFPASFKDFIPNPYRLGYYMTLTARNDFGADIWNTVIEDTYQSFPVYPFTRSLKKNTGMRPAELYERTMAGLDSMWSLQGKDSLYVQGVRISPPGTSNYTNYRFPHYLADGSVLALKDAFDEIRTFTTLLPGGEEKKLFPYGLYTDDHIMFSGRGDLITWAEAAFDERWVNMIYSVIKVYNTRTGQKKKITSRTRYFAPSPSPDGERIVAVRNDQQSRNFFVILDAETGDVIKEWPSEGNTFIAQPEWSADGEHIIAIEVSENGNCLSETNINTGERNILIPYTDSPISQPYSAGQYVFFSAGFTGIDNIYCLDKESGHLYQVTSVPFGAYEPAVSPDGTKLVYSSYTALGYQLEEIKLTPDEWARIDLENLGVTEELPVPDEVINLASEDFTIDYDVKPYKAFTDGLFNIYGWFPTFGNNQYGFDFYTRNIMSTLRGTIGIFYNDNEKAIGSKIGLSYAALYPIFDFEYGHLTRRNAEIRDEEGMDILDQELTEDYWYAGVRFPFRFTSGPYFTGMEMGGGIARHSVSFMDADDMGNIIPESDFHNYVVSFTFDRLLQRARQHVQPRWGQTLFLDHQKAWDGMPERTTAGGALFFPGLYRNHSFNASGTWKKEAVAATYRFMDDFVYPRGYRPDPFNEIWVASANYELPVWYPDIALGPVAFLQRFRTNLFVDYGRATALDSQYDLNSYGIELMMDVRLLRLFSSTLLFRYSYVPDDAGLETIPFQFLVARFELAN